MRRVPSTVFSPPLEAQLARKRKQTVVLGQHMGHDELRAAAALVGR